VRSGRSAGRFSIAIRDRLGLVRTLLGRVTIKLAKEERRQADIGDYRVKFLSAVRIRNTARLRKALGTIPANVKRVPADFDRDDLGSILAAQGYSAAKRTFFVWEAVSQYLTDQGVRATFDWLVKAAPGSRLAFTYVRKDFLDGKTSYGWESGYRRAVGNPEANALAYFAE
jgi:methyltransferase (TIGR00027 family)